ncbi:MAG: Stp1/IreP family PP2C-type Ser/Thr phosphatase [Acidobacteriota bacterium]
MINNKPMFRIESHGQSDLGLIRENNEDYFGIYRISETHQIFIVADGMGGHKAGEIASKLAVEKFYESYSTEIQSNSLVDSIKKSIDEANKAVFYEGNRGDEKVGMGTTLSVLILNENKAYLGHVGDSRAYLIRDNKIHQLTTDHSLVGKMVREGVISKEEARLHPRKNVLYMSLGVKEEIEPEIIKDLQIEGGDIFLLCSDGLSNLVTEEEIVENVTLYDPEEAIDNMVQVCLDRGAPDNVTVEVIKIEKEIPVEDEKEKTAPVKRIKNRRIIFLILILAILVLSSLLFFLLNKDFFRNVIPSKESPKEKIQKVNDGLKEKINFISVGAEKNFYFQKDLKWIFENGNEFLLFNGESILKFNFSQSSLFNQPFPIRPDEFPLLRRGELNFIIARVDNPGNEIKIYESGNPERSLFLVKKGKFILKGYLKDKDLIEIPDLNEPFIPIYFDEEYFLFRDKIKLYLISEIKENDIKFSKRIIDSSKVFTQNDNIFIWSNDKKRIEVFNMNQGLNQSTWVYENFPVLLKDFLELYSGNQNLILFFREKAIVFEKDNLNNFRELSYFADQKKLTWDVIIKSRDGSKIICINEIEGIFYSDNKFAYSEIVERKASNINDEVPCRRRIPAISCPELDSGMAGFFNN